MMAAAGTLVVLGAMAATATAGTPEVDKARVAQGQELFGREWLPNDPRSHGGDGLGPVYNDSSCIACHNAGAPGGGGPTSKNVDIVSAFSNRQLVPPPPPSGPGPIARAFRFLAGMDDEPAPTAPPAAPAAPRAGKPNLDELVKVHAGFRTARSVVLHRFGTDAGYDAWRDKMIGTDQFFNPVFSNLGGDARAANEMLLLRSRIDMRGFQPQAQFGEFTLVRSQRNPTALFGAGLLDAIPESALIAASKETDKRFPEIQGRISRQKDGRFGRFGWKAQTPSLKDFVLTACAVELGLEVPDHPQAGVPLSPKYKSGGLDLTGPECGALESYVRALPAPVRRAATSPAEAAAIAAGAKTFETIGCASCHRPKLGPVAGLYSDLLLHDMGPELGDTGAYGVFVPDSSEGENTDEIPTLDGPGEFAIQAEALPVPATAPAEVATPAAVPAPAPTPAPATAPTAPAAVVAVAAPTAPFGVQAVVPGMPGRVEKPPKFGAARQEWRTPPLWGVRDSGPYLHDGRAETLDQAIAFHGGQGEPTARRYFQLAPKERLNLQAFLKSLVAPTDQLARAGD
jgi:CxxC motif-containing protein (DUF1111 family)